MNQTAPIDRPLPGSFRDPSGFLFHRDGVLYRQVNNIYQEDYALLMKSGLYDHLVSAGLLIPHGEVSVPAARPDESYRILRPEPIDFISYPYEWSFGQLKSAALATLQIQTQALKYGMSLKDSSAYNIQFHKGRPILIDTLSFEKLVPGRPWIAYRQFCQHFLAPLSLMAYKDIRLGLFLRDYIDGLPLDLAAGLLPLRSRFVLPLFLHIYLHAASQKRYSGAAVQTSQQMSKSGLLGLIDNLEAGISRLRWSPKGSEWYNYYDLHNYSPAGLEHKERLVAGFLEKVRPANVWDLGANTGKFSRLASRANIPTIAIDNDPGAVELNYRQMVAEGDESLLPLIADLTNPSPAIGWENRERSSLLERGPAEMVLALALIHHLAISNNVPFLRAAEFFKQAGRWLIAEFIPKSDSQVQRLLANRKDIFTGYNQAGFEENFSVHFNIHKMEKIQDSDRSLYLMEKR